jgi:xanthine dehydrogenase accessory factor
MALADALFDGSAELAGVRGVLVADPSRLLAAADGRGAVPVTTAPLEAVLGATTPEVLVDARMRKRAVPEAQRALAPLTIGLGPNFVAGEPRPIAGHARDRYVYAPVAGTFETDLCVGGAVRTGEPVVAGEL